MGILTGILMDGFRCVAFFTLEEFSQTLPSFTPSHHRPWHHPLYTASLIPTPSHTSYPYVLGICKTFHVGLSGPFISSFFSFCITVLQWESFRHLGQPSMDTEWCSLVTSILQEARGSFSPWILGLHPASRYAFASKLVLQQLDHKIGDLLLQCYLWQVSETKSLCPCVLEGWFVWREVLADDCWSKTIVDREGCWDHVCAVLAFSTSKESFCSWRRQRCHGRAAWHFPQHLYKMDFPRVKREYASIKLQRPP